jgi:hypothetical protein
MLKRTVYIPWHRPEYLYKADVGTPARHTVDQIEINVYIEISSSEIYHASYRSIWYLGKAT